MTKIKALKKKKDKEGWGGACFVINILDLK